MFFLLFCRCCLLSLLLRHWNICSLNSYFWLFSFCICFLWCSLNDFSVSTFMSNLNDVLHCFCIHIFQDTVFVVDIDSHRLSFFQDDVYVHVQFCSQFMYFQLIILLYSFTSLSISFKITFAKLSSVIPKIDLPPVPAIWDNSSVVP